jgi:hypothetical protein
MAREPVGLRRTVSHRFDFTGVLVASASLLCLSFALIEGSPSALGCPAPT